MGVARSEVIEAYRWILGRAPESEETIAAHQELQNAVALRIALVNSEEFRNSSAGVAVAAVLNKLTAISDPVDSKSGIGRLTRRLSMLRGNHARKKIPRGFLYVAVGPDHRKEVARSIESLRAHGNEEPIAIFTDQHIDHPPGSMIKIIQSSGSGKLDRITQLSETPFQRTIFLDTDTIVVDKVSELFDLTNRFDVAVAHEHGYRGHPEERVSEAFFELNTGVIVYRWSTAVNDFISNWLVRYRKGLALRPTDSRFAMDQVAFRYCLWMSDLKLYVLTPEYNYRSIFPGFARDRVKIFHGRHRDFEAVMNAVNSRTGARVFEAYS